MARTADRKLAIAAAGLRACHHVHGLDPADLLFDPLVLPISTGMESDRAARSNRRGRPPHRRPKFPECQTTVGPLQRSFGLKPAARWCSTRLPPRTREAGLTSAIVHFGKILPQNKIPDEQWNAAIST
jgi:5-methyltetrahydrofolate--homocysteine methyltransferase